MWQAEADNIRLLYFRWPTGVNHTVQINIIGVLRRDCSCTPNISDHFFEVSFSDYIKEVVQFGRICRQCPALKHQIVALRNF